MIDVSPDLLAFLKEEEVRSRNEDLLDRAEACLDAYNGKPYGDEEDGRSQVVTRDVAEVCDHMEVSVLRTFVSGDHVAEFEPDSPDAEQYADDATRSIHRYLARNGYQLLHDWLKEGNICIYGIVKVCMEQRKQRVAGQVPGLLLDPESVHEAELVDEEHDIYNVVMLMDGPPELKAYLVPLEEYRGDLSSYRSMDDMPYQAHATPKSLSELVEMGFDKDDVESLQSNDHIDQLSDARRASPMPRERSGVHRQVLLFEEYARFDANGDGIAEMLCIHRVGDTILRIEETDYHPFVGYCPYPMPGAAVGHALAEKTTDIQRVSTVLLRNFLDFQYCNNAPGYIVPDSAVNANTYDDLLTVRPNRIIRTTGKGEIVPEVRNDTSQSTLAAMEFMQGLRESRTGITRLNQGLDADTLNKTASGQAQLQAQGQQIEEYIARNFCDAVAKLMRLILKLKARYGQKEMLRVDGEYREVDPSQWPEDMDVTIRVGLGSGRKEQRLQYRTMLLQIQRECMMGGLPIVGPEQIYKSIAGAVKDMNLGSPADFVIDPETLKDPETGEMPPPPPSPEEQKVQADIQAKQAELQMKQAEGEQQIMLKREEMAAKIQLEREKAQAEAVMNQQRMEQELILEREKMAMQHEADMLRARMDMHRNDREADRKDRETDGKLKSNRPGGELDK